MWFWKFWNANVLRLKKVLDFGEAYSVDGEFLGLQLASKFPCFSYGVPELSIIAPTAELEQQIRDIIATTNQPKL